jgi:hypothetical protein
MSDNKNRQGKADRERINLHEAYELRDWAAHFNVSEDQIRKAVEEAGPMVKDVETVIADMKRKHK